MDQNPIATHYFGNTGQRITRIGLGGEGILRTHGRNQEAGKVIFEAIEQGITYFDSARVYADSELYYGRVWKKHPDVRTRIFQASKSAKRDRRGALTDLEQTLERLQTDYLDLWQIHDVRTPEDLAMISGPAGALEAFIEAKTAGKVRFIGVTGHHDPEVLTQAVRDWPVDSVMMPINPVEGILGGFVTETLPEARKKRIAVIGMKVLGASHYISLHPNITAEVLFQYALSFDIDVAIVGCTSPAEVRILAKTGRKEKPFTEDKKKYILSIFKPVAQRLAYYRGGIDND
jgi:aryl-alcohol dehydrogenase-like predicted oxidoreductase